MMPGILGALELLRAINAPAPKQVETYRVFRFRKVRRRWGWVAVGNFTAADRDDARKQAHKAIGLVPCITKAIPLGERLDCFEMEVLAP